MGKNRRVRLPRTIRPINYKLEIIPNLSNLTFKGHVTVDLQVIKPTSRIVFNAKGLNIVSAIYQEDYAIITYNEEQERVIFELPRTLWPCSGSLRINFNGTLASDMLGLYYSTYTDENGQKCGVLATQFESVFARRAFPCMDEPDRKATFDITIVALDNQVALSNMPEISRDIIPTPEGCSEPPDCHYYVKVTFDRTPVMSTYLVAMVVGHFEFISSTISMYVARDANSSSSDSEKEEFTKTSKKLEIRVYTAPGKCSFGKHALTVVEKSIPFYTNLFGYPYPLSKLDLVAIPDFACNAMENWGLITYRETALLIDPKNSSLLSQQKVALTVAHEVSHMWFGNLVTMSWWTDLWLNEGFATWAQYLAVDYCFPNYRVWNLFVSNTYTQARRLDELKSSHPIEVEVNSAVEVEEIFDAVSYAKGCCVIRMLHNYMGAFRFQKGLRAYFERFKYSNASTQDLWTALETTGVSGVAELMSLWTKQTGYPVIFARPIRASDGTHSIGLKQQRFLADSTSARSESPVRWRIPIAVCDVKDSKSIFLNKITFGAESSLSDVPCRGVRGQPSSVTDVGSEETIYVLPNVVQAPQVRLNPDAIGFYRVRYDSIMLDSIIEAISSGAIPTRDRIALLDDQFALARAGLQGLDKALNFCLAFVGERRYSVWSVLSECLAEVRILLEEATYPEKDGIVFPQPSSEICGLDKLCAELALPVYAKIGFTPTPKDSNRVQILRPIIISILGSIGYSDVITSAQVAFQHHYKAVTSKLSDQITEDEANLIPPDLRSAVYSICMRNGGEEEFSRLLDLYSLATLDDERVRILSSLGAATDASIIHRLFNFTFTEEIRKQDRFHALLGVTVTAGGRRALWNLVRSQFARLSKELGTSHLLGKVLAGSASGFASLKHYEDIKAFFERHDTPCPRAIAQALESVRIRMEQWKRDGLAVREFLNSQYPQEF